MEKNALKHHQCWKTVTFEAFSMENKCNHSIKHTLIFDLLIGIVDPYLIFWRMLLTTWISNKCTHSFSLVNRKGKRKKRLVNELLLFNSLFHRMGRYIYITNKIISNIRRRLVRGDREMFSNQLGRDNLPRTQTKPKYINCF